MVRIDTLNIRSYCKKRVKFFLFADDTNIYFEHSNLTTLQRVINKELKKLSQWLNANRLALNISKTNFVIFAAKNKPLSNVTILLNKKAIEEKNMSNTSAF